MLTIIPPWTRISLALICTLIFPVLVIFISGNWLCAGGWIFGIVLSLSVVARTLGEEKMLVEELDGYVDYKKKVKYRLIPYIW